MDVLRADPAAVAAVAEDAPDGETLARVRQVIETLAAIGFETL